MSTIGLGILSWRGAASLRNALQSYENEGFFSLFDQSLVFLPDPDPPVLAVANNFAITIEQSAKNAGIMDGMEQIAKRLDTDYILLTENDCPLIEPYSEAKRQLQKALSLLQSGQARLARMRHVKQPGEPFSAPEKYNRYFPKTDTISSRLRRFFRPRKAKRLCGTAIYTETDPEKKFPDYIKSAGDGFYLVDAKVMPWSNQSVLIDRKFFLNTIIPYAKSVPFTRGANGFRALEIELNRSRFWTKSGWKIACGPGLLSHQRLEDRGY